MKIKAAVMHHPMEPLAIETLDIVGPKEGEVLIKLSASGICHSDLGFLDGQAPQFAYPMVLGHEGAGTVVSCGPGVTSLDVGDHVLPMALGECGKCEACRSHRSNLCETCMAAMLGQGALDGSTRLTLNGRPVFQMGGVGAFATHVVVAEIKVAKIRPDAPLETACLASCAVSTGVGAAVYAGEVRPGETVAVFGLGGIGLNIVQGARLSGAARIIGVDVNPRREAIGRRFGVTDFVNSRDGAVDAVRALVPGGVDVAFEAVGAPEVVAQAIAATHAGWGRTIMLGVPSGAPLQVPHYELLAGRTLKGVMQGGCRPLRDTPRLVDWYMQGRLDLDGLITHRLPLDEVNHGIDLLRRGEAIRVVLDLA